VVFFAGVVVAMVSLLWGTRGPTRAPALGKLKQAAAVKWSCAAVARQ
jgi:hypothetical protein